MPFDMMDSVPRHLRFLVIEDDDLNSLIMRTSIETGFRKLLVGAVATTTTHAKNGEEAMRLIGDGSSCAFDVVVCDQHMEASGGEMKGTDLVSALRALKFQSRAPVAVLASGNTSEAEIVTYRECGADIVWPKPYPSALQIARDIVAQLHKREQPNLPPATPAVETEQPKPARSLRSAYDMLQTIIPDVPSDEYDASRRKIVAKRDVGLVRAIACVEMVVRMITIARSNNAAYGRATGVAVARLGLAQWTPLLIITLDLCVLWWVWNPKRWRCLAQFGNAFVLVFFGLVIFESARGACDDPTETIPRCIAYRAHLIDPGSISIYYVFNVLIFLWGGLRFKSHMRTVAIQAVLIVAGAFQNGCHASSIADTVFMVAALFGIVLCVERKRRFHFLESVLREQACMQQQTLVTLLWCVPLTLVRWRLCWLRLCLTLPVLPSPCSREIKNPLNVVVFFMSELGECIGSDSATNQSIAIPAKRSRHFAHLFPDATNSVRLLVEIVENCRHLAKVDSGTYAPQEEEIELRQMAESCLGLYGREREAGLEFDLRCPAELTIVSDRLLWRHVLMNLIGNAVKFTMHGRSDGVRTLATVTVDAPRVTVRIERVDTSSVRVEVLDNGPGVDIGDQATIFGKFAQASRGFKAQGLGSGLGLHLSAKTIQMLRGELKLTSPLQPLGCGASFGESMLRRSRFAWPRRSQTTLADPSRCAPQNSGSRAN